MAKISNKLEGFKELMYAKERLHAYVFKNAEPMIFYTRKEIDKKIAAIKKMNEPYDFDFSKEKYVAESMSTNVDQAKVVEHPIDDNNPKNVQEPIQILNADDYPGYPDLHQKKQDRNQ